MGAFCHTCLQSIDLAALLEQGQMSDEMAQLIYNCTLIACGSVQADLLPAVDGGKREILDLSDERKWTGSMVGGAPDEAAGSPVDSALAHVL